MIRIVWQNENLVVCDKPALVLSVPSRDRHDSRSCLGLELQRQLGKKIYPVHRLDFEVSGLIIFALNEKSHRETQSWFNNKLIQKKYLATTAEQSFQHWPAHIKTERQLIPSEVGLKFVWKTQVFKGKKRAFESANGEWAETQARIVGAGNVFGTILLSWELYPVTGKSHQLRFELSRRGFPIIGDQLYGSSLQNSEPGIALRAVEIELGMVRSDLGLPKKLTLSHRRT